MTKRNETGLHGLRTEHVTADDLPYARDDVDEEIDLRAVEEVFGWLP